jgi:SAM-dependent methyltransferase
MDLVIGEYCQVARDYYDSNLHPTCANFRAASRYGLAWFWKEFLGNGKTFGEVGCGKSMLIEFDFSNDQTIVAMDAYPEMLRYTANAWEQHKGKCALKLLQANSFDIPFDPETFDGIFGSLADPYNEPKFYAEAYRVLRTDGRLLFTVPDYEWSLRYRSVEGTSKQVALFKNRDGTAVSLPSHIYPYPEQVRLLQNAGFGDIRILHVTITDCLKADEISQKLFVNRNNNEESRIITIYLAWKQ